MKQNKRIAGLYFRLSQEVGRNYIEVGQYLDYVFPAFGIRFIAIQDNVDTSNRDSNAMEMMPIMNDFNEWHAANTSKKIRAIKRTHAIEGIYSGSKVPYGYLKGTDAKRTFVIDEEIAPIVVRTFEMYASGISPKQIAEIFNDEGVLSPGRVAFLLYGRKYNNNENPLRTNTARRCRRQSKRRLRARKSPRPRKRKSRYPTLWKRSRSRLN